MAKILLDKIVKREGNKDSFRRLRNKVYKNNKEMIEEVPVFEFIKKVIIHIPDKNLKIVIYFGLYSRICRDIWKRNLFKKEEKS